MESCFYSFFRKLLGYMYDDKTLLRAYSPWNSYRLLTHRLISEGAEGRANFVTAGGVAVGNDVAAVHNHPLIKVLQRVCDIHTCAAEWRLTALDFRY